MTERFKSLILAIHDFQGSTYDLTLQGEVNALCNLINGLNNKSNRLEQENEQLNSRIRYLENKIQRERNATTNQHLRWSDEAETKIKELSEENEQLKLTMKEVVELLEEEVDLFSDKATEHDICAYVELKELDNKDAFYMATSTKKAIKMLKELEE